MKERNVFCQKLQNILSSAEYIGCKYEHPIGKFEHTVEFDREGF